MSTAKLSTKYDCAKTKVVGNLPADAKGAHVANALRVDAGIGVSIVYAKRVLGNATGHGRPFEKHSQRSTV